MTADNVLYVAESGLGAGDTQHGVQAGIGLTGSVTAIYQPGSSDPVQRRIASRIASVGVDENGLRALGPAGVAAWTKGSKSGIDTVVSGAAAAGTDLGKLLSISQNGHTTALADPGAFDIQWTKEHMNDPFAPPGQWPDANPYNVLISNGHTYIVDSGSNTLDEVLRDGTVKILAYFPNSSLSDVVPTCVGRGPDGALYIGALDLAGFVTKGPGTAFVYRVDPATTNPNDLNAVLHVATVWATGFTTITGCTFGPHGDFYAAEMFAGDVVRVPFAHPATGRTIIGAGQLTLPNGVAVDPTGAVYVTNFADNPHAGTGQVVRFTGATPTPHDLLVVSNSTVTGTGSLTVFYSGGLAGPVSAFTATCTSNDGGHTRSGRHRGGTAVPITVRGVTTKKSYRCKVTATTAQGVSPPSPASAAVTVGTPGRPNAPSVTRVGNGHVKVSFSRPPDNGRPITSFRAVCRSMHGVNRGKIGTSSPIGVKSLTAGQPYTCTVQATNLRGAGPFSPPSTAVIA